MRIAVYSNKGFLRGHNEDALSFSGSVISKCNMFFPVEIECEGRNNYFAVIDGMGGYEGGEIAANIIAKSFGENANGWNVAADVAKGKITDILHRASREIAEYVKIYPEKSSMGAALSGIVFCSDSLLAFNCGDCRVYSQQAEYLEKLSHDHSVVQELFDLGKIDEKSMRTHKQKNIITACVSAYPENINIYFRELKYKNINSGQKFFICSDGIWEALPLEIIEKCHAADSVGETAKLLTHELTEHKETCKDNVSFIVIEFTN